MQLKSVIEQLYGTSIDPFDYEQSYEPVTFNGMTYGELPTLPDMGEKIGLKSYPLFDELYRPVLNGKIIDRYFNREIGSETIGDWRLILRRKMNEIMPIYNQLYESTLIPYSALDTMDIHSVNESSVSAQENGLAVNASNTDTDSDSRAVNSETPQTILSGNGDYATSATDVNSGSHVDSGSTSNTEGSSNTDSDSDTRVKGYQGAASDLIVKYRNSLINIDTMILEDIHTCFMLVLNNGDEYTKRSSYSGWWY
jgi:hypothetical protein